MKKLLSILPDDLKPNVSAIAIEHLWFKFPNGYGASVIPSFFTDGYEIAVLGSDGDLCYSTPVTNDVKLCVDEGETIQILYDIKSLPSQDLHII